MRQTIQSRRPCHGLAKATGMPLDVKFNPMVVVNVKAEDALRLLISNVFDAISIQIDSITRDDPFFGCVDLAGVSTDMVKLRAAMEGYRQVFYCNKPIKSAADFKSLKVRGFTPTLSAMPQNLGATTVSLSFSEVHSALGNGVVDRGVTSANCGNSGKWPEATQHFSPLSVSGAVQGHFVTLAFWDKLSPDQQNKMTAEFRKREEQMWKPAEQGTADSIACNTGQACKDGTPFKMPLVPVSTQDDARVKAASEATVLPMGKERMQQGRPDVQRQLQRDGRQGTRHAHQLVCA